MEWFLRDDFSAPVITAHGHILSSHGAAGAARLPKNCVLFELGGALERLASQGEALLDVRLPCFLGEPRCVVLKGREAVCFVAGNYGAPAAAETLETLLALGVRRVLVAGLCGAFGEKVQVGDILVPRMVLSEEGTSRHYAERPEFVLPDGALRAAAAAYFRLFGEVLEDPTVTTDAVYRQTFRKEELWRQRGCVGVDMEASALLTVCRYYGVPAAAVLMASDKHPIFPKDRAWDWGNSDFHRLRGEFVSRCAEFGFGVGEAE